jgi:folate-binding protein YgfZ
MPDISVFYHLTRPAAVLRATGPDAFTFLQSQFSNELRHPELEQPVTYGLWLDHKGKIQADSFILQKSPENFLLMSYDCPATAILAHLGAHLVADEVELRDETANFGLLHVWPGSANLTPTDMQDFQTHMEELLDPAMGESWMGRRPTAHTSWDFLAPFPALENIARDLEEHGVENIDGEDLDAVRILAGVPAVPRDAALGELPQEAGLEHDALSFDKGCYLGQEVMSRLHSQGHVNRALWRVSWKRDAAVAMGAEPLPLYAGETLAGELRSRALGESGGIGLAMLKNRAISERPSLTLSLISGGPDVVALAQNLTVR